MFLHTRVERNSCDAFCPKNGKSNKILFLHTTEKDFATETLQGESEIAF
jgi:hypothetical protein